MQIRNPITNLHKYAIHIYYNLEDIKLRDSNKNEIDLLIKNGDKFYPIEIKAGSSFNSDYLKGIKVWNSLQKKKNTSYVVYNGKKDQVLNTKMMNWADISSFTELIN